MFLFDGSVGWHFKVDFSAVSTAITFKMRCLFVNAHATVQPAEQQLCRHLMVQLKFQNLVGRVVDFNRTLHRVHKIVLPL